MPRPSEHNTCDLLAAYEFSLLDPEARLRFEQHLETCPDCLDELYSMAPLTTTVMGAPGTFVQAATPHKSTRWHTFMRQLERIFNPHVLAPIISIAAVVLFVLLPSGPKFADLAQVTPLPFSHIQVRAGDDDIGKLYQSGMTLYTQSEYAQAAAILLQAAEQMEDAERTSSLGTLGSPGQARLYAGVSLLLAEHPGAAKTPLQTAAKDPLPPVSGSARWYLAQAYLLTDSPDSARVTLESLTENPVYWQQAQEQMDQLEETRN